MEKSHPVKKKEAPGVTASQQVTNKDGEQINLKEENTPTRAEKEKSGKDTAGSNLPGHKNPGKPKGLKGDLNMADK